MSYTKLFSHIVTSSIWSEDDQTRILWITMLALADKHGEVMASVPGLSKVAGLSIEATEKGLEKFMSPDPYSRTPDEEGRRVQKIDGGWLIINYAKHRRKASVDEEREKNAERQRRFRERNKVASVNNGESPEVTTESRFSNGAVTVQTDNAEAEAEAEPSPKRRRGVKMLSEESVPDLKAAYGPLGVNVELEVKKAKIWISKHPERKLTIAFMENWLSRAADTATPPKKEQKYEVLAENDLDYGKWKSGHQ